jgi:hypothetical protein
MFQIFIFLTMHSNLFHYQKDGNKLFINVTAVDCPGRIAYAQLEDMRMKMPCENLSDMIKVSIEYYKNPVHDKLAMIQAQLDTVKNIMIDNIDKIMERGEQLEQLDMGLSAGGLMKQIVETDYRGVDHWDINNRQRVFVHIVNSEAYKSITGNDPPETCISAETYTSCGYPWYDLYEEHKQDVKTSDVLAGIKSVKQIDQEKGLQDQQDDTTVTIINVKQV